jgi:hypothetical protein
MVSNVFRSLINPVKFVYSICFADAVKNEKKESLRIWTDILSPLRNVTNFLFFPVSFCLILFVYFRNKCVSYEFLARIPKFLLFNYPDYFFI